MGYKDDALLEVRRDQTIFRVPQVQARRRLPAVVQSCRKTYDHHYNLRNHRPWADQKLAWQQSRGLWLREMKTGKTCTDCGGSFPPEAMQWDHLPGTVKLGEISSKIRRWSTKLIFEELANCELVCANCHAIRTYKRLLEGTSGV